MPSMQRSTLSMILPLALLALGACKDRTVAPSATRPELQGLGPGIHPVLSIPDLASSAAGQTLQVSLHLEGVQIDKPVSSYQGEFRFDPDALSVVSGSFPKGILGAWNEIEPGRIRFAGVAMDGLGETAALGLTVQAKRPLQATDFHVAMEEVTSVEGFTDLTQKVVTQDAPILTTAPFRTGPPSGR